MPRQTEPSTDLTVEECRELAAAMLEDAAALPPGPKKEEILKLAKGYSDLAEMKNWLSGKLNWVRPLHADFAQQMANLLEPGNAPRRWHHP
jgi:hypothetical protein